jgi:hypothetical protein
MPAHCLTLQVGLHVHNETVDLFVIDCVNGGVAAEVGNDVLPVLLEPKDVARASAFGRAACDVDGCEG